MNTLFNLHQCNYHVEVTPNLINILNNISLTIPKNKITLIKGRSGSGKTTLLHCLAGLIQPQSGKIMFNDTNICQLSANDRANYRLNNTGIIYQAFNFLPSLTIYENIILPAIMANQDSSIYEHRCQELTTLLGINQQLQKLPQAISGGELQRAALVRALINQPQVIFADEPTGNLDTSHRDIIFDTFKQLNSQQDLSLIFTSHDPKAATIADHIIEITDGFATCVK
tara:strand:+ start:151 stop:831 length:681 start_codon:yes stop_codon:yes gene_type:complete